MPAETYTTHVWRVTTDEGVVLIEYAGNVVHRRQGYVPARMAMQFMSMASVHGSAHIGTCDRYLGIQNLGCFKQAGLCKECYHSCFFSHLLS